MYHLQNVLHAFKNVELEVIERWFPGSNAFTTQGVLVGFPFPRVPKLENSPRICREGPDRKTAVFAGFSSGKL